MGADADFSDYLAARWPALVAALESEGLAPDEARLAVAEVLVAHRRGWRRLVAQENVDVVVWQALLERTRLPVRPGSAPVTGVGTDLSPPGGAAEPWLARAEALRRARRWRDVRRWLLGLAVAALVVGLVWWDSRSERPAVRDEANPLPIVWYAGAELHLPEVVVELPDVASFVESGDGAAVRRLDGEVLQVDGDGDVSSLADPPSDLTFPPEVPDYLPFGSFTSVVQGAPVSGGRWAYVLDSQRRDTADAPRILVLCDAALVCRQLGSGIPAPDFRIR